MALTISSPAFADGDRIPAKYTRDGENLSPPLRWSGAPQGTRSFMLVVEDPDAPSGMFYHWAVYNIPADRQQLAEAADTGAEGSGFRTSFNGFGNSQYDGPEPPVGHGVHHYHFHLAALDVPNLTAPPDAGADVLWREASKHILADAELVGTYAR